MTDEQSYHREQITGSPTARAVYVGPDRPLPLDLPDHYAEADPPDDIRAVRGIVLGMALASVFWLAFAGWMIWR